MSFDAFGLRRDAGGFAPLSPAGRAGFDTSTTTRGFTGHEGLDPVGLVHMNGRAYDPLLGRFISADPHVQEPRLTQSHNRYSYALNNPLNHTDPDGHFFRKLLRVAAAVVAHVVFGPEVGWLVNSLAQTAIELLPDAGRVGPAFGQEPPTAPATRGPGDVPPGRLCLAAECRNAPAEIQAALGHTVGGERPGLPNGAATDAYRAALAGDPDGGSGLPPSRVGQAWTFDHPLGAEFAVAFIPFGCAYTEDGCAAADIAIDVVGLVPIFKPVAVMAKVLRGAGRVRKGARTCSFAAGTTVATPDGPRPIEAVEAGDWVLARDAETGQVAPKRVSLAYSSMHDDGVLLTARRRDGGREAILTTAEHPFRVDGGGWVPAGALSPGDALLTLSGEAAALEATVSADGPLATHNFEVEGFHTYAVGEDGIWVHNACDPSKGRKPRDSSKNERHGDSGRAQAKADQHIEVLEEKMRHASRKERLRLDRRIKNIAKDAKRKRRGETHHRQGRR